MTTAKHEIHKVCLVVRNYPESSFWCFACAMLAAAVEGNLYLLGALLVTQLVMLAHIVRRMWAPPITITIRPEFGRIAIPSQPRAPRVEGHRHARH
jgi:hypothetical protein